MTDVAWAYLVCRYWRFITWVVVWLLAFAAPSAINVPLLGWCALPLVLWLAVTIRRRRQQRTTVTVHQG